MSPSTPHSYALRSLEDATRTNGAGLFYEGDENDNTQTGTAGDDGFDYSQGGNDTLNGGGGQDEFYMGAAFTAEDKINGGASDDTLFLDGDYSTQHVFGSDALTSVEYVNFADGHSYNLAISSSVNPGARFLINSSALSHRYTATFSAADTDQTTFMVGGDGKDHFNTSRGICQFEGYGGDDSLYDTAQGGAFWGGNGDDTFRWNVDFAFSTRNQLFDGGRGYDVLDIIGGDFDTYSLSYPVLSMINFERVNFHVSTMFTLPDTMLPGRNGFLQIYAYQEITLHAENARGHLEFTAQTPETTHFYGGSGGDSMWGGTGIDVFFGSGGQDSLDGREGNDFLNGGAGADGLRGDTGIDTFIYSGVSDSTGAAYDVLYGLNPHDDVFQLIGTSVSGVALAAAGGTLDTARFNHDLKIAVGASVLPSHYAVLYTPDDGDLAGRTFLIVDVNGTAGYQANQDYVIELREGANLDQLSADNF